MQVSRQKAQCTAASEVPSRGTLQRLLEERVHHGRPTSSLRVTDVYPQRQNHP